MTEDTRLCRNCGGRIRDVVKLGLVLAVPVQDPPRRCPLCGGVLASAEREWTS